MAIRKATEKEVKAGKGKSTDELSKAKALAYFKQRSKSTGAKSFRWRGDVYDLEGNKKTPAKKAAPKKSTGMKASPKPKARPTKKADSPITVRKLSNVSGGRGDGRKETVVRAADAAIKRATKPKPVTKTKTPYPDAQTRAKDLKNAKTNWQSNMGGYTKEQWKSMTKAERVAKGLPRTWVELGTVGSKNFKGYKPTSKYASK